jgi:hypothetical protein
MLHGIDHQLSETVGQEVWGLAIKNDPVQQPESCLVKSIPILSNHSSKFFSDDFRLSNYLYIPQS